VNTAADTPLSSGPALLDEIRALLDDPRCATTRFVPRSRSSMRSPATSTNAWPG